MLSHCHAWWCTFENSAWPNNNVKNLFMRLSAFTLADSA
jgi:hypothetical protein